MTTREVAKLFRVDAKTVTEWARTGLIPYTRTPGGGRNGPLRFREEDVQALLDQGTMPPRTSGPG